MTKKYKRVLLKVSGESLAGKNRTGIDFDTTIEIARQIKKCTDIGVQVALVVGGGNFWRGRSSGNMDRVRADYMGMMATIMNSLGLSEILDEIGVKNIVQTSIFMSQVAEVYNREKAKRSLEEGRVVIFAGGTGHPFFSTDTAAALRAAEIGAEIILKASTIDGVYDSDPNKNKSAVKYEEITFSEVLDKNLNVIDSTATSLCRETNIPILVFSIREPENIFSAITGNSIGTLIKM